MKAISQADAPVAIEGDGVEMRIQELGGGMSTAFVRVPKGEEDPKPNRNWPRRGTSSTLWRRTALGAFALALIAMPTWTVAAEGAQRGNSAATITASFGDSCADFEAHSSKDISHVEIHYADGRVVKHEAVEEPDVSIAAGDEVGFAIVKSGTTALRFDCELSDNGDGLD